MADICPVNVPFRPQFTIERLLTAIKTSPEVLEYLPNDPHTHVNREYLCNIINTLDPVYFRKAIDEVECARGKMVSAKPKMFSVSQDMLELLS